MKNINHVATLSELKNRAKKKGLTINKYQRGEELYMLVNPNNNTVAAPAPMTLPQVEMWLDDLADDDNE